MKMRPYMGNELIIGDLVQTANDGCKAVGLVMSIVVAGRFDILYTTCCGAPDGENPCKIFAECQILHLHGAIFKESARNSFYILAPSGDIEGRDRS